jgi:hypothetical protein
MNVNESHDKFHDNTPSISVYGLDCSSAGGPFAMTAAEGSLMWLWNRKSTPKTNRCTKVTKKDQNRFLSMPSRQMEQPKCRETMESCLDNT